MAGSRSGSPIVETLAAFAIVAVLQFVTGFVGLVATLFVLAPPITHNPWTIVTSVYAHQGLSHLLSNAVLIVLAGWPIARATTRLRFHTFFVATGALAGVSQIVVSRWLAAATRSLPDWIVALLPLLPVEPTPGVLGASGAGFALLGYLIAGNRLSEGLAGVVAVPRWLTILVFLGLAAAVTMTTAAPGVALIAHFTGFLLGLLAGRIGLLRPGSVRVGGRTVA